MKTLVVYYSRTGNTKFVAEKVAQELGAEIEELTDQKKRDGLFSFFTNGYDSTREKKTRLAETTKNPLDFDFVILGTPVWNARPTPAMRTYLGDHDLSGKKVAIFCANMGKSGEEAIARTKSLIPDCDYVEHLVVSQATRNKAESENKISDWCGRLKSLWSLKATHPA